LCFTPAFWEGDELLLYLNPEHIQGILSHIPTPSLIQSVAITPRLFKATEKQCPCCALDECARALVTVLEKIPSVTDVSFLSLFMHSKYLDPLCEMLSTLSLKSLSIDEIYSTVGSGDYGDLLDFKTVCRMCAGCPNLVELSMYCVFPTEEEETERIIPDLHALCPHLTELGLLNALNNTNSNSDSSDTEDNNCSLDLSQFSQDCISWELVSLSLERLDLANVQVLSSPSFKHLQHLSLQDCRIPRSHSSRLDLIDCAELRTVEIVLGIHPHCHHNLRFIRCPNLQSVYVSDHCKEARPNPFKIKAAFEDLPLLDSIAISPKSCLCKNCSVVKVTWGIRITNCPRIFDPSDSYEFLCARFAVFKPSSALTLESSMIATSQLKFSTNHRQGWISPL